MSIFILISSVFCNSNIVYTSTDVGFTYLHVKPNKTITISLKDRAAVILDARPNTFGFSLIQKEGEEPKEFPVFPSDNLYLTGYEMILKSSITHDSILPIWLIAKTLCNYTNSVISAEHHLSLTSSSKKFSGDVCLFSQTIFQSAKADAYLKSKDKNAKIEIYSDNAEEPAHVCNNGKNCHFHNQKPFFIHIKANPTKSMKFQLEYEVNSPSEKAVYCKMNSIPAILHLKIAKFEQILGDTRIKCESKANDILQVYKYAGIILSIVIVCVIALHFTGLVDFGELLFPDEEKARFDNLKRDPYAARIEEQPAPGGATDDLNNATEDSSLTKKVDNNGNNAVNIDGINSL